MVKADLAAAPATGRQLDAGAAGLGANPFGAIDRALDSFETMLRDHDLPRGINAALSHRTDINHLLERILERVLVSAKAMTHADGATLYHITEDGRHLRFELVRNESLGIAFGGVSAEPVPSTFHDLPLDDETGAPNRSMVATYAARSGQTINLADAYAAPGFDFAGMRSFDRQTGYRSQSVLAVPLRNRRGAVIGVLQLINARHPATRLARPFTRREQKIAESLAKQAAAAMCNRQSIALLRAPNRDGDKMPAVAAVPANLARQQAGLAPTGIHRELRNE